MSPFVFSKTCQQRESLFPNHKDQQPPTMGCTYPQPTAQAPHRRTMSEPINEYYRYKLLPRLPHEIETYRSRSLPEPPSVTSRPNDRPLSKYAPKVPPCENRPPLPSPPLRTSEPAQKEDSTVETIRPFGSESFFPCWSRSLLSKCESSASWEEKLTFARERRGRWAKRRLFAHEVQGCAYDCACGMNSRFLVLMA